MNRHLDGAAVDPHFGFMLGHVCKCPNSGVLYSVVDTAIAAREVLAEEASGAFLIRAWAEARSAFTDHSGVLLGWYHSHHLLGLMLSASDEESNERYFGLPWQASIIVVPDSKGPLGGVFRLYPDAGEAERRQPSRFYELYDEPMDQADAKLVSAVVWTNYEVRDGGPDYELHSLPEVDDSDPMATDELYPVQLVMPGEGDELELQPVRRRRKLVPVLAFIVVMAIVALATVWRGLDRTPVMTLPQVLTVHTQDQRRFFDSVEGLDIGIERYGERATDFDAGRIGCDLLTTGYASADASFVETATSFRVLGEEPGREAQDAYEAASGKIAAVNAHFDGSGCPRP